MLLKFIRWFLGNVILTLDAMFKPKAIARRPEEQARIDQATAGLSLYQFEACPFCVKTRRAMKRLGLNIPLKDATRGTSAAEELVKGGGELQVPCLRIPEADGSVRWLYESSEIIRYLEGRFSSGSAA